MINATFGSATRPLPHVPGGISQRSDLGKTPYTGQVAAAAPRVDPPPNTPTAFPLTASTPQTAGTYRVAGVNLYSGNRQAIGEFNQQLPLRDKQPYSDQGVYSLLSGPGSRVPSPGYTYDPALADRPELAPFFKQENIDARALPGGGNKAALGTVVENSGPYLTDALAEESRRKQEPACPNPGVFPLGTLPATNDYQVNVGSGVEFGLLLSSNLRFHLGSLDGCVQRTSQYLPSDIRTDPNHHLAELPRLNAPFRYRASADIFGDVGGVGYTYVYWRGKYLAAQAFRAPDIQ